MKKQLTIQYAKYFRMALVAAAVLAIGMTCNTQAATAQEAIIPPLPPMPTSAVPAELPESAVTQPREGETTLFEGNWTVQITPKNAVSVKVNPKDYQKIYNSIPYRRAEYLANPSYRHDTTVEIMFGQMRPTVIHRQDQPQRVVNPRPGDVDTSGYQFLEYMSYPGRILRYLPGFGPTVAPFF